MADNQNSLIRFWQELKRRKVVKVIVLYATTAFILLQIVSLIITPLHLPEWVETFFIVLLVIGFPIAVIFSWIFDVTPQGIEITVASHKTKNNDSTPVSRKKNLITNAIIIVLFIVVGILVFPRINQKLKSAKIDPNLEKSIAVLPLIDDSPTEGNAYIINGLMEEILNKLEKIEDLRVVSRTTAENYRDSELSLSEIAKELNVTYVLEGSGLKVGDRIKIMLQLIEAKSDRHLWSNPYQREVSDENIFELQEDVALLVATELQAIITPEEEERIIKKPTENLTAYDYYLKGKEALTRDKAIYTKKDNLTDAIKFQNKALEYDNKFALAYAELTFLHKGLYRILNVSGEQYSSNILKYAHQAMLYDSNLDQSWLAIAAYYDFIGNYKLNALYLEKVLEFNPNSSRAIYLLSHIYGYVLTDTEKSLEYALKLVNLDVQLEDAELSNYYFKLAKSLRFSGFFDKSLEYIEKSIKLHPNRMTLHLEKAQLLKDKNEDSQESRLLLTELLDRSSNMIIVGSLAHMCYLMRDYKSAYEYYNILIEKNERGNYSGFTSHLGRAGLVYAQMGKEKEANELLKKYEEYVQNLNLNSIGRHRQLTSIYSYLGKKDEAMQELMKIKEFEKIPYWIVHDLKQDPLYDNIRDLPEYQRLLDEQETIFWKNHKKMKNSLEEKRLL